MEKFLASTFSFDYKYFLIHNELMNDIRNKTLWKDKMPAEVYEVVANKGTEAPFTGKYWNHHEKGMYHCTVCGEELFHSDAKFDSGTGWPSSTDLWTEIRLNWSMMKVMGCIEQKLYVKNAERIWGIYSMMDPEKPRACDIVLTPVLSTSRKQNKKPSISTAYF